MKKAKIILPLACALLMASCGNTDSSSSSSCSDWRECVCKDSEGSISLYRGNSETSVTLAPGEETTIYADLVCIWDAYVKFTSSDPSVATIEVDHVNTSGGSLIVAHCNVKALAVGKATLKASYNDISSTFEVTVAIPEASSSTSESK